MKKNDILDTVIKNKIDKFISQTINESVNDDYPYYLEVWEDYQTTDVFFMFSNKENPWTPLIEPSMYQKALNEFTQYGQFMRFPTKYLYQWANTIIKNIGILYSTTEIAGHSQGWCDYEFIDFFFNDDEEEWNKWKEENGFESDDNYGAGCEYLDRIGFWDWCKLPDGSDAWSDYGLPQFGPLLEEYDTEFTPEECLVWINKCLDVAHPRGDIASMFIRGGSKTLSDIRYGNYVNEHLRKKKVLHESLNNFDSPLYHNTSMTNLIKMMQTNSIKSGAHRGFEKDIDKNINHVGICFTRNPNYNPYNYYDVLLKFDVNKLQKYTRGTKLMPYQDFAWQGMDEYEERLISKQGKSFELKNLNKLVSEVVVILDRTCIDIVENGYETDEIIEDLKTIVANNIFDNFKIVKKKPSEEGMNLYQAIEYINKQTEEDTFDGETYKVYAVDYYDESHDGWTHEEYTHSRQEALDAARDMYEQNQIPTRVAYGNYNGYDFNCESIVEEFGEELEKEIW